MKNVYIAAALTIAGVCVGVTASAAGPDTLMEMGNNVWYPTWFPGSTKLCAQNLGNSDGRVTIHAGFAQEDIFVGGGGTVCIDRNWAGVQINVANAGSVPMKVWTQ